MKKKLSPFTRISAVIASAALLAVLWLPIWRIELTAPQYPGGLVLQIRANGLDGDVDVVNGLNHYIGMRTLHTEDFVEFTVLPYLIGIIAVFGLLSAIINRKWFFYTWGVIFFLFCVAALVDFYIWEYNYGHNLDPAAPIKVEGMSYQPPLIGYKKLLNFGAYSIPDTGGWFFIAAAVLIFVGAFREIRMDIRRPRITSLKLLLAICLPMLAGFAGCNSGPQPFRYGEDICDHCKMTIIEKNSGAELLTKKGKIFRFDDIHCLKEFIKEERVLPADMGSVYLVDYTGDHQFIVAEKSFLLKSEKLRTPMNGQIVAFESEDSLKKIRSEAGGELLNWKEYNSR